MKHISVFALSAITAMGVIPFGSAHAMHVSPLNANGMITNNIAAIQHSIIHNTFDKFGSATDMGEYALPEEKQKITDKAEHEKCPPVYGKMRPYGEYNDDGSATIGHSGGDDADITSSNYNWFNWLHAQDKVKYKDFDKADSRYDLVEMGFSNEPHMFDNGYSQFGGFGGLIIAQEKDTGFKIEENGGFIGLFQGYHIGDFNIQGAADFGALFSDTKATLGDYDYTHFWAGAGLNISYDIALKNWFTLQPGVYGGYTWIYSKGYESATGNSISIDSVHMMELAPAMRAITRFGNGWYGALSGRYVFNFNHGGDATVAGTKIPELELMNYAEYGLSIEKNADRFGIGVSLNRRDGGRTGWLGGLHVKYIF